uniref:hypothetical protein n=1 Tax=Myxobolus shantungensis TaxID=904554 RepID=UPI003002FC61
MFLFIIFYLIIMIKFFFYLFKFFLNFLFILYNFFTVNIIFKYIVNLTIIFKELFNYLIIWIYNMVFILDYIFLATLIWVFDMTVSFLTNLIIIMKVLIIYFFRFFKRIILLILKFLILNIFLLFLFIRFLFKNFIKDYFFFYNVFKSFKYFLITIFINNNNINIKPTINNNSLLNINKNELNRYSGGLIKFNKGLILTSNTSLVRFYKSFILIERENFYLVYYYFEVFENEVFFKIIKDVNEYLNFVGVFNYNIILESYLNIFCFKYKNLHFLEILLLFKFVGFFLDFTNKVLIINTLLFIFDLDLKSNNQDYPILDLVRIYLSKNKYKGIKFHNQTVPIKDLFLDEHLLISSNNSINNLHSYVITRKEFSLFCKGVFKDRFNIKISSDPSSFTRLYSIKCNSVLFLEPFFHNKTYDNFYFTELCGIVLTPYNFIEISIFDGFRTYCSIEVFKEFIRGNIVHIDLNTYFNNPFKLDLHIHPYFHSTSFIFLEELNCGIFGNMVLGDKWVIESGYFKSSNSTFTDRISDKGVKGLNFENLLVVAQVGEIDWDNYQSLMDQPEKCTRRSVSLFEEDVYTGKDKCLVKFYNVDFFKDKVFNNLKIPYYVRYLFKNEFCIVPTLVSRFGLINSFMVDNTNLDLGKKYLDLVLNDVGVDIFNSFNYKNKIKSPINNFEILNFNKYFLESWFNSVFYDPKKYNLSENNIFLINERIFNFFKTHISVNNSTNSILGSISLEKYWGLTHTNNYYNDSSLKDIYNPILFRLKYLLTLINKDKTSTEDLINYKLELILTYKHLQTINKYISKDLEGLRFGVWVYKGCSEDINCICINNNLFGSFKCDLYCLCSYKKFLVKDSSVHYVVKSLEIYFLPNITFLSSRGNEIDFYLSQFETYSLEQRKVLDEIFIYNKSLNFFKESGLCYVVRLPENEFEKDEEGLNYSTDINKDFKFKKCLRLSETSFLDKWIPRDLRWTLGSFIININYHLLTDYSSFKELDLSFKMDLYPEELDVDGLFYFYEYLDILSSNNYLSYKISKNILITNLLNDFYNIKFSEIDIHEKKDLLTDRRGLARSDEVSIFLLEGKKLYLTQSIKKSSSWFDENSKYNNLNSFCKNLLLEIGLGVYNSSSDLKSKWEISRKKGDEDFTDDFKIIKNCFEIGITNSLFTPLFKKSLTKYLKRVKFLKKYRKLSKTITINDKIKFNIFFNNRKKKIN